MAIRIKDAISGNTRTTIDDSRNFFLNNLTFSDSSSVSSLGLAPGSLKWTLNNPDVVKNTSGAERFGYAVAADGNLIVASAPYEYDGNYTGAVYVIDANTLKIITSFQPPTQTFGFHGQSIGLSGNNIIVGSPNFNAADTDSGVAYIYNAITGALVWTLNNPNYYSTSASDYFGYSVAISGNYAIVGAYYEDDTGGTESGKAYIYNVTTGALVWTLNNPNYYGTSASDNFGNSVAIDGNYAIVGAYYEDDTGGTESGKAYIFDVTTGALVWTLNNPNYHAASGGDNFGVSVAISGNYAIVGANNETDTGGTQSGKAYIFNVTTGALVWALNNPNAFSTSQSDQFGVSVAISGNYAIVGAYLEGDARGDYSGKAYVYNVVTGQLLYTLNNPNSYGASTNDYFGWAVGISQNIIVVGAWQEDSKTAFGPTNGPTEGNSGAIYFYRTNNGSYLTYMLNPDIYVAYNQSYNLNDEFGRNVATSGIYAAISAPYEEYFGADSSTRNSGVVYIFNLITGKLIHTLYNPNKFSNSFEDQFGYKMSMFGNYLLVSASEDEILDNTNSGKVYLYNVTTGVLVWTFNNPNAYSTSFGDAFGYDVAISGNYAIISAAFEDDATNVSVGKAYIFNITTGQLVWTLNNPNTYALSDDIFGYSVGISGNYAIVGAPFENNTGETESGAVYVFNVTTGQLLWSLHNPNAYSTVINDYFGYSVAISGNYAIVGAYYEDDTGGTESGKAYIYNVTTGTLLWTLNNPNAYAASGGDNFGYSVAISGNYAIVGAWYEDDAAGSNSGKAYIFNVTTGALLYTLNNPNSYSGTVNDDNFGSSVAISGNYAIVGARLENSYGISDAGTVYVYNLSTPEKYTGFTSLSGLEKLTDQNTIEDKNYLKYVLNNPNAYSQAVNDQFGYSVGISGNYAIVGAWQEDEAGGVNSGKAYIFNVTTGALLWTLNNPNYYGTSASDYFGSSVAISGNYAIVGAYGEDETGGNTYSGKAYIFNVTTGALLWTLNNPNYYGTSFDDFFGYSVGISGNYAIVGAYSEDDSGGSNSGKAYIFNVTTGALVWTLNNPNYYAASGGDLFGAGVAISGNYAIVGAYYEDDTGGTQSGKAYIFNVTTGALVWALNNPNYYSTSASDYFGYSVAIDGNYAIVGAYYEDDTGGTESGKAYIFNVTTGALVWALNNPSPSNSTSSDQFGYSVAISGNYAIVGALYEDTYWFDAGGLYVFNIMTGELVVSLSNPSTYGSGYGDATQDYFGNAVAMSGNNIIVGARDEDEANGLSSGKAYIFSINNLNYKSLEDKLISLFHY